MATVTVDREVVTPQQAAFDAIADFTSSASWDPGIASSRRLDGGPVTHGSRFEVRYRFGPLTLPLVYEITRHEPPYRVVLATRSPLHTGEDDVRFRSCATGTAVELASQVRLPGTGAPPRTPPPRRLPPCRAGSGRRPGGLPQLARYLPAAARPLVV
jgi:hypothetical protein